MKFIRCKMIINWEEHTNDKEVLKKVETKWKTNTSICESRLEILRLKKTEDIRTIEFNIYKTHCIHEKMRKTINLLKMFLKMTITTNPESVAGES